MTFKRRKCAICGCKPAMRCERLVKLWVCNIWCRKCLMNMGGRIAPSKEQAKAKAAYFWNFGQKRRALVLNLGGYTNEH
nr:MAG TPA: hypothetical protein [Caudoviricetes sp.]